MSQASQSTARAWMAIIVSLAGCWCWSTDTKPPASLQGGRLPGRDIVAPRGQPRCTGVVPRVFGTNFEDAGTFPRAVLAVPVAPGTLLPAFIVDTHDHVQSAAIGAPMTRLQTNARLEPRFGAGPVVQLCYSPNTHELYAVERAGASEAVAVDRVVGPWGSALDVAASQIAMFTSPWDNDTDYVVAVEGDQLVRLAYRPDKPTSERNPRRDVLATSVAKGSPLSTLVTADGEVHVAYVNGEAKTTILSGADAPDVGHMTSRSMEWVAGGWVAELLLIQTADRKVWLFYADSDRGSAGHFLVRDADHDTGPIVPHVQLCTEHCRGLRAMTGPDGTDRVFYHHHDPAAVTGGASDDDLTQLVYTQALDRGNIMRKFWAGPLPVLSTQNLALVPPGADGATLFSKTAVSASAYDPFVLDDGSRGLLAVSQEGPTSQRTVVLRATDREAQAEYQPPATFTFYGDYTRVADDENWPSTAWVAPTPDASGDVPVGIPTCSGQPPTSDAQRFPVLAEAPSGCGDAFAPWANSSDEARTCVRDAGLTETTRLCDYEVRIAREPSVYVYVRASSEANAIACARARDCNNCSGTVTRTLECTD